MNNLLRLVLWAFILIGGLIIYEKITGRNVVEDLSSVLIPAEKHTAKDASEPQNKQDFVYLPTSTTGEIVKHQYYTLSFHHKYKVAEWVAYDLTKAQLQMPRVQRSNDFRPDPNIANGSAAPQDYIRSGYDRGHLCPAEDRSFSETAMSETFFMSNITPQKRNFNVGIWKTLEDNVRDWTWHYGRMYVIAGPILSDIREYIGTNEVAVPENFYKILLVQDTNGHYQGIAYLIPNKLNTKILNNYVTTIAAIERETGIVFFPKILTGATGKRVKNTYNVDFFPLNKKF